MFEAVEVYTNDVTSQEREGEERRIATSVQGGGGFEVRPPTPHRNWEPPGDRQGKRQLASGTFLG